MGDKMAACTSQGPDLASLHSQELRLELSAHRQMLWEEFGNRAHLPFHLVMALLRVSTQELPEQEI